MKASCSGFSELARAASRFNRIEVNPSQIDCDANGFGDVCDSFVDCNANGVPDSCDITDGALDTDNDGNLDACEMAWGDWNLDGVVGANEVAMLLSVWGYP